jgi:1-acyl-sn-glycerol-3-phosphate acyltransferase
MKSTQKELPLLIAASLSVLAWFCAVIFTTFYSLTGIFFVFPFSYLLDRKKRRAMHIVSQLWGKTLIATSPIWNLTVRGTENFNRKKHYVIVCNHQSMLDILIVLAGLPAYFKFLAKKDLFWVPILGWHMSLAKYIPLHRGSTASTRDAMIEARTLLRNGVSVLFFPEGTRSASGELQAFKKGAFKIAYDEGVDILPLAVDGGYGAVPKNSWKIKKKTDFVLLIGKPIKVRKADSVEEIQEKVREQILKSLQDLRKKS